MFKTFVIGVGEVGEDTIAADLGGAGSGDEQAQTVKVRISAKAWMQHRGTKVYTRSKISYKSGQ